MVGNLEKNPSLFVPVFENYSWEQFLKIHRAPFWCFFKLFLFSKFSVLFRWVGYSSVLFRLLFAKYDQICIFILIIPLVYSVAFCVIYPKKESFSVSWFPLKILRVLWWYLDCFFFFFFFWLCVFWIFVFWKFQLIKISWEILNNKKH